MKIKRQVVISQGEFNRIPIEMGEELARMIRKDPTLILTPDTDRLEDLCVGLLAAIWHRAVGDQ